LAPLARGVLFGRARTCDESVRARGEAGNHPAFAITRAPSGTCGRWWAGRPNLRRWCGGETVEA